MFVSISSSSVKNGQPCSNHYIFYHPNILKYLIFTLKPGKKISSVAKIKLKNTTSIQAKYLRFSVDGFTVGDIYVF
jgi:hypothetical protein